jgi:hypothetical protein
MRIRYVEERRLLIGMAGSWYLGWAVAVVGVATGTYNARELRNELHGLAAQVAQAAACSLDVGSNASRQTTLHVITWMARPCKCAHLAYHAQITPVTSLIAIVHGAKRL